LIEDRTAGVEGRSVTNAGQQMARLNLDLSAAVSDRAKKEASLAQITTARPGSEDLQSVPEVVSSPLIQRLREQQAELGAKEAGLAMSRGWSSPELSAVHASQRDVATQIALETAKIAASLRSAVAAARNTEDALRAQLARLQSQVGAQGQTEVKLHELQNEADVAKMIYAAYLKGSEETANQIDSQEPDAIVVARAGVPIGEAPPTRQQLAGVGVLISVVLALLQALVRERRQSGFRTSEDLEAAVGIKTLALVPRVRQLRDAMRFSNPKSMFPEAINSIRALLRLNIRNGSNVLMVTSAAPQEGKTVLSTSLARSAALAGDRVLLVDCDLRRPAVSRYISSVDEQVVDNVTIRRDSLSSLSVITLTPDGGSPQDFFASAKMATLMATLRARYDLIVLDTPPVLAVTDARVLSALADVTILVVGWRKTPRKLVGKAVAELRSSGAQLAGTVITQVRLSDLEATDAAQAYIRRHYAKYVAS
jgi:capsular exopolysaccharide synthesis family protein